MKNASKVFLAVFVLSLATIACSLKPRNEVVAPVDRSTETPTLRQPTLPSQITPVGFTDSLEVLSTTLTANWEGFCTVAGEVRNSSDVTFSDVEIAVALYDSTGIVIGADHIELERIPPGRTYPFEISLINCLDNTDHVIGQVINAEVSKLEHDAIDSLEVLSTTLTAYWEGFCTVTGEVSNSSNVTYADVEIAVALYDSTGIVIGADQTELESIPPGRTYPFEISLINCLDNTDRVVGQVIDAEVSKLENEASDSLEVMSTTLTAYWEGFCTVAGEVRNNSGVSFSDVGVAVTLYDSMGIVIGADQTELENIPPGRTYPFEISLINCLENSDRVGGQVIDAKVSMQEVIAIDSLEVLSTTLTAYWEGFCTVAGEVRNGSEVTYSNVEIAVTLYDSMGIVIGADHTELESLPPGRTYPFEISLINCLDNTDHIVGQVISFDE